ncbi:zinc finger domain-containing protein [Sciscionella sediminilitoris]|uniref:zinc finger domain-containing protein n=1 Tax=Sciscionella sediminilitoris TaxID=1445613 RepID=UPI0004DF009E|nr:hypothetical protein [Sciscionella sp. SE31]
MTLTRDQVVDLLSLIVAHDGRNPSESDLEAWSEQAALGRWTWPEARDAVITHFHHTSEWIMPSHVAVIIRGRRQDKASRRMAEHRTMLNQPASDTRVREIVDQVSASLGWVPKHGPVLSVPCPHCHAAPGYPCTRSGRTGKPDIAVAAHPSRRDKADQESQR